LNKICTLIALLCAVSIGQSQTWQITDDLSLKEVTKVQMGFQQDFGKIKQATDNNKPDEAQMAIWDFQRKYPEMTGGKDWQAYAVAELTFAKRNWKKSSELFTAFLDEFPVSQFYNAALEREYEIATAFLNGQKRRAFKIFMIRAYDDGEVMMEKIAEKAGNSSIAHRALVTLAESFEKRYMYFDAYDVWTQVALKWPTGDSGKQSLLAMARCMHSAYNGPDCDGSPVKSAEGYYGQYKLRYPELAAEQGIDEQITIAVDQIAYKQYMTAEYYKKTMNSQSAAIYYGYVNDTWPNTKIAPMAAKELENIKNSTAVVRIKPEDKNLLWRFWHFFDFNPVEKG